jgi:hypothetical protein
LRLLATAALIWPQAGRAEAFSADYGLWRAAEGTRGAPTRGVLLEPGSVRIAPAFQAGAPFPTAGLSLEAGRNWFARAGLGRSVQPGVSGPTSVGVLSIAGGYRWSDGQALSLQLTGEQRASRLGLSVSYDWPRYFVRLAYDTGLKPVPQRYLRFSAGMRF